MPLFFIGLGSDRPPRDLRLADLLADESAFVGDLLHFDAKLTAEGLHGPGGRAVAPSWRAGDSRRATPSSSTNRRSQNRCAWLIGPISRASLNTWLKSRRAKAKSNVENNRLTRKVTVREETIRVLLVQAYPSYEFRFLKQMLAARAERQSAGGGQGGRLSHGAARGRSGIWRNRQDGRAGLSRQSRRAVSVRRADLWRREPGAAQPVDHEQHL